MLNARILRPLALAIILMGAFHLRTAQAAEPAVYDQCDSYAAGYADGYCDAQGKDWSSVTYTCTSGGQATGLKVTCAS